MIDQWEDDSDEALDQAEIDSLDDDDFDNSYTDSDRYDSPEDDAAELRVASQCDGCCDPQCDWCLVGHRCPDECADGPCPYEALDPRMAKDRAHAFGYIDAFNDTKRARLTQFVRRRDYLDAYERYVRRNDPRRKRAELKRQAKCMSFDIGF